MAKPLRVLMVEDSESDMALLLMHLRRLDFEPESHRVDTRADLEAALATREWDLVMSDHNMPSFSGTEALKIVRSRAPDLPFVVVSGTLGEEHAVNAMRAGASDFVVKTKLERLPSAIEHALREAEQRREQRRIGDALASSQNQVRQMQKLEAVSRFAGGIAHDFNNLLTTIRGYSDLLLAALPDEGPHRRDVELIKDATDRGAALTKQLLAFSRQQVLHPSVIDMNDVVDSIARLLRRVIGERIALVTPVAADLWRVTGDRTQLEQIIMNLAVNARDAMPQGGTLTISTANVKLDPSTAIVPAGLAGEFVSLEVRDTGGGIPDDVLPKIFEPFFTTKEPGQGTGLGLATVYGIVQQSRGGIAVDTRVGRGTAVSVYLPRTA